MARKNKELTLPEVVYVKREKDGDDTYLCAFEETGFFDENDTVGVYELRATKKKRTVHELV